MLFVMLPAESRHSRRLRTTESPAALPRHRHGMILPTKVVRLTTQVDARRRSRSPIFRAGSVIDVSLEPGGSVLRVLDDRLEGKSLNDS